MSSLEELLVFKDVAQTGNITETSRRLHMSQPSVSIQIQNLEREYGAQLLDRTNRGVTLTECGQIFFQYADEVIQLTAATRETIINNITYCQRRIHIGATFTIGEYLVPYIVGEFHKNSIDSDIDAKISNTEILAQAVLSRKLHLALVEGPVFDEVNFSLETFWHDELVVVVPIEHPWSERKTITFDEFLQEKLITREQGSGTRRVMELAFEQNGFNTSDLNIGLELGSTQAIKLAVKGGMGITVISALTVQEECRQGQFVTLRIQGCSFARPLNILTHKKGHLTPNEQSFISLLRNHRRLLELFPAPVLPQ
ncbi:MAG: LysR family transcriptional regulator [Raoultibacter sp.]